MEHAARLHLGLAAEAGAEVEGRAMARDTLDPDLAVHQLHQFLGDGQAQPGAAVLARS
ncbi:hypothetical protein D3C81_2194430 [compost metagenome]